MRQLTGIDNQSVPVFSNSTVHGQYWGILMYKPQIYPQLTCADFDQLVGLKINPENRWIKKAAHIP